MIDLSNLRTPGWQRVVAELSAPAADDRVFLARLTAVLGQVSSARQAVFWRTAGVREDGPAGAEPKAQLSWPYAEGSDPIAELGSPRGLDDGRIDQLGDVRAAARSAASSRQPQVFSLDNEMMYDAGGGRGYVIAVPVTAGGQGDQSLGPVVGVVTLLLEPRSRQAVQTTLAILEICAGYIHGHAANQSLRRMRQTTAALDLATRLIASINATEGFKGCCIQLANDLCRQLSVDRVAIGWVEGPGTGGRVSRSPTGDTGRKSVKMIALSDTEQIDRRLAMVQKLEHAMEESLDQEQTVLYPPPPAEGEGADVVLLQAVTQAHRELAATDARLTVASFPLRIGDPRGEKIVGVVTIESGRGTRFELGLIELMQSALDLLAPVLAVRHSDDRALPLRAWDSLVRAGAWAVGPKHTVWKLVGVIVMLATIAVFVIRTPYRIGAPMELQPFERRTIAAPFDGIVASLGEEIEAGRKVAQGDLMVELDTTELKLQQLEARSQIVQFETQADEELKRGNLAAAQQASARAEQARSKHDLLAHQIERATIAAPMTGTIITGDLKDKIGSQLKLGDKLFEIADLSSTIVVAKVEDSDIAMISEGQTGELSPKSNPSFKAPFVVDRIVPLSRADEGQNAFEVYGRLTDEAPAWFKPGMEGRAKFNGETKPLVWIGTRRIADQLRIWLWW